jgi:hypothetical protein
MSYTAKEAATLQSTADESQLASSITTVDALPWVSVTATGRREALDEARTAIAEWLDVPPIAFDVGA